MRSSPPTLREVARIAGVSTGAASKVLHGAGDSVRVGAESAQRIREVAKSLNYHPNALARSLRSTRTHTVGLIFEDFIGLADGPLYYLNLLDGIGNVFFKEHYRLTILAELQHGKLLSTICDGNLEGVIWCKLARDNEIRNLIENCPIPIVAMNTPAPEDRGRAVFVSCDNKGGVDLAVEHLHGLGHRRILFLTETHEFEAPDCIARREGFVESMARRGSAVVEGDIQAWTRDLDEFGDWWASKPPHTAILAWNERVGGLALKRAAEFGLEIPRDLSVVGFDSTAYCETTQPRLTAVRQPIRDMASRASELLLSIIAGHSPEQSSFTFPCDFDVRDSTDKPRLKVEEGP